MTEGSYVGLSQCFFCGGDKNEIMFDLRLRNSLPHKGVYNYEPCESCASYMKMGVILISVKDGETDRKNPYKTGGWVVVKEDAIRRLPFNPDRISDILKKRIVFLEDKVWDTLGLPREKR